MVRRSWTIGHGEHNLSGARITKLLARFLFDRFGIGFQIVDLLGEIIAENELRHASGQRRFVRADVIRGALPSADAILCRDLLGHLSFAEIFQALGNFKRTGATYLLATTFTGARPNHDTSAGEWRTINLTLPPFNLPEPLRLINEKCTEARGAFSDKSIGVWKLDDVPI